MVSRKIVGVTSSMEELAQKCRNSIFLQNDFADIIRIYMSSRNHGFRVKRGSRVKVVPLLL